MEYWKHQIILGDRVDLLAYFYYDDAAKIEPIYQANPQLPFKNDLDNFIGVEIFIPVDESLKIKIDENKKGIKRLLWKRQNES